MGLESVEAVGPLGVRAAEPFVDGEQTLELESRWAALTVASATDEASPFQHLEVLGDGGLRERRGLRELEDAGIARGQALEDGPSGGVGKGPEGAAQGIVGSHHHKVI